MMTRKHYRAIAESISKARQLEKSRLVAGLNNVAEFSAIDNALESVVNNLIIVLREDNPRFDSGKFITACLAGKGVI